ncbi:hypothetical protein EC844_107128 [Acinetobacter calcoaceticus]|uniref:NGG1p interacting factor NIF3 n=1 Tax=Acinetobacter calcoaceticus TaxID=471 RepID=A0A4R1Y6Q4_ACICA|nr:hypothetical protein EC844_107128 [Acinetobacter calcoaceticus]
MFKLIYYVPDSHLDATKSAIFVAGAGCMGDYEHCAWQVLGTGQFKPINGANPYIGQLDTLEQLSEWRVETIVPEAKAKQIIQALRSSHPYEQPAFELMQLVEFD